MSAVPERFNSTSAPSIGGYYGDTTGRLSVAIRNALAVLSPGTCSHCNCEGCSAEMAEAHRILHEALHGGGS